MDLSLEQKQHLLVTPQMQQAILILQMNNLELIDYIADLALENPVLEIELPRELPEDGKPDPILEKMEWLDSTDEYCHGDQYDQSDKDETKRYEIPSFQGETLDECLHLQLLAHDLNEAFMKIADRIIESLDSNGYLTEPLDFIAELLRVDIASVEAVLRLIQQCEPTGVGARDLKECLLLQLYAIGAADSPAFRIVKNHLDDLAHNRLNHIAQTLNLSIETVISMRRVILALDPKPAKNFSLSKPQYISADVYVENIEGDYIPIISDNRVPLIRINSYYRSLSGKTDDPQVKKYLVDKFRQANWVVKCIEQRNSTILKSTKKLIELQHDFFESGPDYLAPMILSDISESIEMHVSTVSRTFKGKYIQCAWGLFPYSFFLTQGIKKTVSEASVSSQSVKAEIRQMISNENKKRPKSDDEIVKLLEGKDIRISRRTVAKYRSEIGILSSKLRKEF